MKPIPSINYIGGITLLKLFKKIIAGSTAVLLAASLSGCSGKLPFMGSKPNFNTSYSVAAEIKCDRLQAKADVIRAGANDWEFKFTEPKELNGVIVAFGVNGYTAKLGDLKFKADENVEYTLLPKVIGSALEQLAGTDSSQFEEKDGILTAALTIDDKTVTVTADSKGNLISLKSPYHQLSVNFSGQQPYTTPLPDEGGLTVLPQ